MNETRLCSLEQVQTFLAATAEVQFLPSEGEDTRHVHIEVALQTFPFTVLGFRADLPTAGRQRFGIHPRPSYS